MVSGRSYLYVDNKIKTINKKANGHIFISPTTLFSEHHHRKNHQNLHVLPILEFHKGFLPGLLR